MSLQRNGMDLSCVNLFHFAGNNDAGGLPLKDGEMTRPDPALSPVSQTSPTPEKRDNTSKDQGSQGRVPHSTPLHMEHESSRDSMDSTNVLTQPNIVMSGKLFWLACQITNIYVSVTRSVIPKALFRLQVNFISFIHDQIF